MEWYDKEAAELAKRFDFVAPPIIFEPCYGPGSANTAFIKATGEVIAIILELEDRYTPTTANRHVLVHELAHVKSISLTSEPYDRGGHDAVFYDIFWRMAKFAKLDMVHALYQEVSQYPEPALAMAKMNQIPGSASAGEYAREWAMKYLTPSTDLV